MKDIQFMEGNGMNIFKYQGAIIFDSKEMFDRQIGIQSLGKLDHLEYGEQKLAFSGFKKLGKKLGTRPLYLSLDRDLGKAYIFINDFGILFKRFQKNILLLLIKSGYEIQYLNDNLSKDIKKC